MIKIGYDKVILSNAWYVMNEIMWQRLTIAVKVLVSVFLSAIFFKAALNYPTLTSYYDRQNTELFLAIWGAVSLGVMYLIWKK